MPSFNQFLPAVYPVGVTDLQPFFMIGKIGHNSLNLSWIPTKIGTEMCFNKPFMCTKVILGMHWCFMAKFAGV